MSQEFSNTATGDKPADPYKAANLDNDVSLKEKVEDLSSFTTSAKFGMMTTRDSQSGKLVSRCMALAARESGDIDLLFYTNTESNKTNELMNDPHVNISFINSSGEWASYSGVSTIETDRDLVKKHHSSALKAWLGDLGDGVHDGSANDPRIGIIRVRTETVTYSLASKNAISRAAEIAKGAITGKPASVANLRDISADEVRQWKSTVCN